MTTPIAYVLLEDARLLDKDALVRTLNVRHPGMQWERGADAPDARADGPIFIRAGDQLLTILLMPAPMPYDQRLWQRTSRTWPDAFHAVGRHRAHLIVAPMGSAKNKEEATELGIVESCRLTTALVGGVLETLPGCLGVVWRGRVGRSPEEWLEQSRRSFDPFPDHPYSLWMEIVHFVCGETIGAYTIGLSAFIGREIEFEVGGLDQHGVTVRVANASSYLIANGLDAAAKSGNVFEDEDASVGRIALLHRNSRFSIGPVISFYSVQDRFERLKTYEIIPASIGRNHPLLVMLGKVGLFDSTHAENQIALRPDHYVSEVRMESFDDVLSSALSGMLAKDGYVEADTNARRALARGDIPTAKSLLLPWAEEVGVLQAAMKVALSLCDVFMFLPAPPRSP